MPHSNREKELFNQALDLTVPAEREAFLRQVCVGDNALLERLRGLLAAHEHTTAFLSQSPRTIATLHDELLGEQPGDRIGRYKLLEKVGEGGCGAVYVAEQNEPVRRRVALKVIKLGMDTKSVVARFEAERQALALMDHPNIAKVLDAGATERGRPYFVMELVRGIPITHYCDQNNLSTTARLGLFIQVCQAIQHAHQKGVIHRDIKPSNILVTVNDGVAAPKVIDFGIAKATEGRLTDATIYTQLHQFIGTPAYMSPEQAEMTSLDIDTRSDIYSLGVLLYELLSGKTPFEAKDLIAAGVDAMRRTIRDQEPARPSTKLATMQGEELSTTAKRRATEAPKLLRQLQGDLDWIVMKCLEKDRTRRYGTANGLAADLRRHLSNEPVIARPPSKLYEFQKTVQRHKFGFAAAAALVTVLALGVLLSTWQAVRASRAEEQAIAGAARAISAERQALAEAERATAAEQRATATLAEVAAERDAKELARRDAEAISTFLSEVFQKPDPARDGRSITVAEVLDKAVERLKADLAAQPEQRAQLQATLASTYHALGHFREAIPLLEAVRAFRVADSGPDAPAAVLAMHHLAISYHAAGRRDEALQLREEVLRLRREMLGPEHPDTLSAMNNLAASYSAVGRRVEALALQKELLPLRRQTQGPEHSDTLAAMNNLAVSYFAAGRLTEALELREEILPLRRKVNGPEHPDTLGALLNLARSYFAAGRREEALRLHEESLALSRKVLGPRHPGLLLPMQNVAQTYFAVGRREEALQVRQEALALSREVLGREHPGTLDAMRDLAVSHLAAGDPDDALELLDPALTLARTVLGPKHPKTLSKTQDLARVYFDIGRQDDALDLLREVLALSREVNGPEHPETLAAMRNLAGACSADGRSSETLDLREELLPLCMKAFGPQDPRTNGVTADLAESYLNAGRTTDAIPLLVGLSHLEPPHTWGALTLAALQLWSGNVADYEAARDRLLSWAIDNAGVLTGERIARLASLRDHTIPAEARKALTLARRAVEQGGDELLLASFQVSLGMAEYRAGLPEAVATLEAAEQSAHHHEPLDRARIEGTARFYRAMSLFRQGRADEARSLFRATETTMKPWSDQAHAPWVGALNVNDLILWLACREAKALLGSTTVGTPRIQD